MVEAAMSRVFSDSNLQLIKSACWGLACILVLGPGFEASAAEPKPRPAEPQRDQPTWSIAQRVASLDQRTGQVWQVDYRLENVSRAPAVLLWSQIQCDVDGWVSNSRAGGHSHPRPARLRWTKPFTTAETEVISSRDQASQCFERGTFEAWPAARGHDPLDAAIDIAQRVVAPFGSTALVIPPGQTLCVRIRLAHEHFLYGEYEPLLGTRLVSLRLGEEQLVDEVELDGPIRTPRGAPRWPALDPPNERRDTLVYLSPPDSLYLAAHLPGQGYYRTSGQVRYGTRMRVSFCYLLAPGSDADAMMRITQLKQGPALWKPLPDGQREICLTTRGRWTRVERVFRTEDEATTMTLEFRISGELGDLWIEDVRVEPLEAVAEGP
jgi:hypothetical protein